CARSSTCNTRGATAAHDQSKSLVIRRAHSRRTAASAAPNSSRCSRAYLLAVGGIVCSGTVKGPLHLQVRVSRLVTRHLHDTLDIVRRQAVLLSDPLERKARLPHLEQ